MLKFKPGTVEKNSPSSIGPPTGIEHTPQQSLCNAPACTLTRELALPQGLCPRLIYRAESNNYTMQVNAVNSSHLHPVSVKTLQDKYRRAITVVSSPQVTSIVPSNDNN